MFAPSRKKGANDSVQEHTGSASNEPLWAWVRDYQIPNKLRQQQKTPRTTHEVIKQLENAKVPITCLESDCSNYRLIKGVKCCKGALQETDLPEQESSVRQITGDDEFDDHTRKKAVRGRREVIHAKDTRTGLSLYVGSTMKSAISGQFMF